ncbi:hypothetical protein ABEB36_003337 [Hypothenemus hampei]|uniref:Single domain-containing protein n=1 Tax=Hypothenemus hampei TaxID=57062 RepID=A0ABD1F8U9_HYPHA
MKLFVFLTIFLALFAIGSSSLAQYGKKPSGAPGYCWSQDSGPLENGERKDYKDRCSRFICKSDTSITLEGCGSIAPKGSDVDYSKSFPECCPHPI